MGDLAHLQSLGPLGLDEVLDQLFGEDAAFGQEGMVGLEAVQRFLHGGGQLLQLGLLLLGQVEEVAVVGAQPLA